MELQLRDALSSIKVEGSLGWCVCNGQPIVTYETWRQWLDDDIVFEKFLKKIQNYFWSHWGFTVSKIIFSKILHFCKKSCNCFVLSVRSIYRYVTLNLVLPLYNTLIDHCENTSDNGNSPRFLVEGADAAKDTLLDYYNRTDTTDSYILAVVMDPRQKLGYYKRNKWGRSLITSIKHR